MVAILQVCQFLSRLHVDLHGFLFPFLLIHASHDVLCGMLAWSMMHDFVWTAFCSLYLCLSGFKSSVLAYSLVCIFYVLDVVSIRILCWTQICSASYVSAQLLLFKCMHDAIITRVYLIHACMFVLSPLSNCPQVCLDFLWRIYVGFKCLCLPLCWTQEL